ncbi:hypothetical protein FEM48_Zijuj02G0013300 [Ziziphus jujuba var. spinosa]|uniref:RNase III domain-containing protein n=1 Tax=Ziziphus jujuba var. spinosa TaxID=714518 RepID=A0A978VSS5_ZIZJJ|nr:hypothetical protein FEM48_Zijuj02G0013300 [Ziziphus jujuba var. spinosa]
MEVSVREVERIIGHSFKNKNLLEEALTHSSSSAATGSPSYERLEFFGDSIIGFAISKYFFFAYPHRTAGELTWLRSAHVNNDKLARVAVRRGLYDYVRRANVADLDNQVKEFTASVLSEEDNGVVYDGSVEAVKILADIMESIAAAIYIDLNGDLEKLWPVCILNGLLEPRDIIEENRKLHEICQKMQSKQVEIKHTRDTGSIITASVYMDDHFVASGSSDILETARLNAATLALSKLPQSTPADDDVVAGIDGDVEIEAKTKLNELCQKKKWTEPIYKYEYLLLIMN